MSHIKRVANEYEELSNKVNKLKSFIDADFNGVDIGIIQSKLLSLQLESMMEYQHILLDRLNDFNLHLVIKNNIE